MRDTKKESNVESVGIEDMRDIQFSILKKIDAFCKMHDLTYYLTHGTLIGAVRHQGFIPWDDDIDIAMPRKDYEKFVAEFTDEKVSLYSLRTVSTCRYPYTKAFDTQTQVFEGSFKHISEYGVNIDIFPYDYAPDDALRRKKLLRKVRFWQMVLKVKLSRVSSIMTLKQNLIIAPGRILLCFISASTLAKRIDRIARSLEDVPTGKMGNLVWGYGEREIIDTSDLLETKQMVFEEFNASVPVGYDKLLTSMYGDYMALPPKENQITHHDFKAYWKVLKR
jgi:lipopolysaccharide cholinephosphotransferase